MPSDKAAGPEEGKLTETGVQDLVRWASESEVAHDVDVDEESDGQLRLHVAEKDEGEADFVATRVPWGGDSGDL